MTDTQTVLKAEELRIGNWVKVPSGYGKVATIEPYDNNLFGGVIANDNDSVWERKGSYDKDIEPIKLTPEILEKCNVEQIKKIADLLIIVNGPSETKLIEEEDKFTVTCYQSWGVSLIDTGKTIQYVHQLQNLIFALTGSELEIDLAK